MLTSGGFFTVWQQQVKGQQVSMRHLERTLQTHTELRDEGQTAVYPETERGTEEDTAPAAGTNTPAANQTSHCSLATECS